MKHILTLLLMIMALYLFAEDSMVWIEADPDTIYYDDNVTYSIISVKVEDENQEPVEGAHITFGCSIGNLITNAYTNENGIATTDFWESGDMGVASINAVRGGQVLTTYVTILPPVSSPGTEVPDVVGHIHIYPNPFNPATTISLTLETSSVVKVDIYNSKGQKVERILDSKLKAGVNEVNWTASDNCPSGVYFAKIDTGLGVELKKMVLMK